jgi:hypothetical protein
MHYQQFESWGFFVQKEGGIMDQGVYVEVITIEEYWWQWNLVLLDIWGSLLIRALLVFSNVGKVFLEQIKEIYILV